MAPPHKIYREVGRAKDLSAPLYTRQRTFQVEVEGCRQKTSEYRHCGRTYSVSVLVCVHEQLAAVVSGCH